MEKKYRRIAKAMFSNRQKGMESRAQVEGLTSDRRTATSSVKISMLYWKHMLAVELMCVCVCVCVCVSRSVVSSLCDPVDCSTPDSSVHGILQARILESGCLAFSRASSRPKDWTQVSHLAGRFFTIWATWEAMVPYKYSLLIDFVFSKKGEERSLAKREDRKAVLEVERNKKL